MISPSRPPGTLFVGGERLVVYTTKRILWTCLRSYSGHPGLLRGVAPAFNNRALLSQDAVTAVKLDAMHALAHVGQQGDREIVRALAHAARDAEVGVRLAAVQLLPGMAESGNELAITTVGHALEDANDQVRPSPVRSPNSFHGLPTRPPIEPTVLHFCKLNFAENIE